MIVYPKVIGPEPERDPTLAALIAQLQTRMHDDIRAVLVYGSCLRSGDIYDGLLDLYLLCENYQTAYGNARLALANRLLPPNVFYAEQLAVSPGGDTLDEKKPLRAKVTVVSMTDFARGCSSASFESYFWGRFAQPTHILYARDETAHQHVVNALTNAAQTLLSKALPALPPVGKVTLLWQEALALSYATELRTERTGRAAELAQASKDFCLALTTQLAPELPYGFQLEPTEGEPNYRCNISSHEQRTARVAWALRRGSGKLLSVARLVKALFTFEGGLDYIAWKLERHSGEKITVPEKVRRRPLIHLWGFFWGLYQRGIFK